MLRTRTAEHSNEASKTRNVVVEVTDTGMGMDEETRRRCLEPFFTTKGERGTRFGCNGPILPHGLCPERARWPGNSSTYEEYIGTEGLENTSQGILIVPVMFLRCIRFRTKLADG